MEFSWLDLLAAFGGGLFGAAIGGIPAFIFTGLIILAGTGAALAGSTFDFLNLVAFGPVFGPHIAFAGGAAAAAFAASKAKLDDGKNITTPLAGINDPGVLIIGGIFGAGGFVVEKALAAGVGDYTDTVALTVILSAVVARLAFGKTGLFGLSPEAKNRGRFVPGGKNVWLTYQQGWLQVTVISLGAGLISAWAALQILPVAPEVAGLVGFGISAFSLIFLQFNVNVPVTHHITGIAALAATVSGSLLIGMVFGIISGLLGEFSSRLLLIHGDSHIDPPANAIWIMTAVIMVGAAIL